MRYLALLMLFGLISVVTTQPGIAALRTQTVYYKQGDTPLQGYFAYDDAVTSKRPGVLVADQWMGEGPYAESRCRELARMGYVAFACDIYGKGVRPSTPAEAGKVSSIYKNNRALTRLRAQAGLGILLANSRVDPKRVAAIGYCFGGLVVMELARSGADIAGVVAFHGDISTPDPQNDKPIQCKVLALQGGDDPFVTQADVESWKSEMRAQHVDWQLAQYGGAVHAYTVKAAGNDPSKGIAYNAQADRHSWQAMKDFFSEIFAPVASGH